MGIHGLICISLEVLGMKNFGNHWSNLSFFSLTIVLSEGQNPFYRVVMGFCDATKRKTVQQESTLKNADLW